MLGKVCWKSGNMESDFYEIAVDYVLKSHVSMAINSIEIIGYRIVISDDLMDMWVDN